MKNWISNNAEESSIINSNITLPCLLRDELTFQIDNTLPSNVTIIEYKRNVNQNVICLIIFKILHIFYRDKLSNLYFVQICLKLRCTMSITIKITLCLIHWIAIELYLRKSAWNFYLCDTKFIKKNWLKLLILVSALSPHPSYLYRHCFTMGSDKLYLFYITSKNCHMTIIILPLVEKMTIFDCHIFQIMSTNLI